jgi:hypothetical protein
MEKEWFDRMQDVVDAYQPDLLYSDGGIPFGVVGHSLMADFYNKNMKVHAGQLEAVYTIKKGRDVGDYSRERPFRIKRSPCWPVSTISRGRRMPPSGLGSSSRISNPGGGSRERMSS